MEYTYFSFIARRIRVCKPFKRRKSKVNMGVTYILGGALFVLIVFKLWKRPANFPPGPRGLPIIGYGPFFFGKGPVYLGLQKLAKQYGPVTGFFVGPQKAFVAVVGREAVKEALLNDDLIGRPSGNAILSRTFGEQLGVIFSEGNLWHEQRRFALRHLRDLGFGKTSIEDMMMDEIHDLIDEISTTAASHPQRIVKLNRMFTLSVVNILWALVGGQRYSRNDVRLEKLLEELEKFFRAGNPVTANIPLPKFVLDWFPSLKKRMGIASDQFIPVQTLIRETIEEHRRTKSEGDIMRDFIDVYLTEMDEKEKDADTSFTQKQLIALVQDLFAAGSDTTSNSIGFALLFLIHNPEIQKKIAG